MYLTNKYVDVVCNCVDGQIGVWDGGLWTWVSFALCMMVLVCRINEMMWNDENMNDNDGNEFLEVRRVRKKKE